MSTQSPNIPFDANEFDGKRVLATGGTKGIGEAIVTRLLGGGAAVLAAARTVPADGNSQGTPSQASGQKQTEENSRGKSRAVCR